MKLQSISLLTEAVENFGLGGYRSLCGSCASSIRGNIWQRTRPQLIDEADTGMRNQEIKDPAAMTACWRTGLIDLILILISAIPR